MKNFNQKSKSFTTFLSLLLRVKRERNVVAKKEKNASVMFELAGDTPATPATPCVNSAIVERSEGEREKTLNEQSEFSVLGVGYNPSTRKAAFTSDYRRAAFTLAEVLITLAVIGIVAVLTIPALVQNHQERAWATAQDVFSKKFEVAMKTMANNSTVSGYDSTESFVNELKKYIKITNVCTDDVTKCFAPKVVWSKGEEAIDVTNNAVKYNGNPDDWAETVGVQFANGVNALISYNKQCYVDPYNNQEAVTSKCVGIIYDVSGFKTPNTNGKDILANVNVAELSGKLPCIFTIPDGDRCVTKVLLKGTFSPMTRAECEAQKDKLGINGCLYNTDYWAGAVAACGGTSKMATMADLGKIANLLYEGNPNIGAEETKDGLTYNGKASELSLPEPPFIVWSSKERNSTNAYRRTFGSTYLGWYDTNRGDSYLAALCLGD